MEAPAKVARVFVANFPWTELSPKPRGGPESTSTASTPRRPFELPCKSAFANLTRLTSGTTVEVRWSMGVFSVGQASDICDIHEGAR